jgi:hypothetical protein
MPTRVSSSSPSLQKSCTPTSQPTFFQSGIANVTSTSNDVARSGSGCAITVSFSSTPTLVNAAAIDAEEEEEERLLLRSFASSGSGGVLRKKSRLPAEHTSLSQLFLCLFRACLGKLIVSFFGISYHRHSIYSRARGHAAAPTFQTTLVRTSMACHCVGHWGRDHPRAASGSRSAAAAQGRKRSLTRTLNPRQRDCSPVLQSQLSFSHSVLDACCVILRIA